MADVITDEPAQTDKPDMLISLTRESVKAVTLVVISAH
jgi:hypothetical protein